MDEKKHVEHIESEANIIVKSLKSLQKRVLSIFLWSSPPKLYSIMAWKFESIIKLTIINININVGMSNRNATSVL